MTVMQPYEAWLFFGDDNIDEVNKDYAQLREDAEDGGIYIGLLKDVPVDVVTVIAAEVDRGIEHVWALRNGKLERYESWQVRRAFQ